MREVVTNSLEKKLSEVLDHEVSLNENYSDKQKKGKALENSLHVMYLLYAKTILNCLNLTSNKYYKCLFSRPGTCEWYNIL